MSKFMLFTLVTAVAALCAYEGRAENMSRPLGLAESNPSLFAVQIAHKTSHRPTIRVTGVITDEGVECTALRGDNGRLYTLAGGAGGFKTGDRVRVIGRVAQVSFCMQGTTIEVRRIVAVR